MKTAFAAAFGWLIPGGAYLLARRYLQFAITIALVCGCAAGRHRPPGAASNLWPQAAELQGLDSFTAGMAKAGAMAKLLAGAPALLARLGNYSQSFLNGQTHEYGTTLLVLAGVFNSLALSDALESCEKCETGMISHPCMDRAIAVGRDGPRRHCPTRKIALLGTVRLRRGVYSSFVHIYQVLAGSWAMHL